MDNIYRAWDGDEKVHTNLDCLDEDMALLSTVTKKSLVSQNQNTLLFGSKITDNSFILDAIQRNRFDGSVVVCC